MSKIPEALRLATWLADPLSDANDVADSAAAELRRLHALNAELLDALKAMNRCLAKNCSFNEWTAANEKACAAIAKAESA